MGLLQVSLVVAHAVLRILQQGVRQRFEVQWSEDLVRGVALPADADDVAGPVTVYDFIVSPRSVILFKEPRAFAAQEIRDLLLIYVLQKLFRWLTADHLDLLPRLLVEPALDDRPDGGEGPWRVHNAKLAQLLRVIVLRNLGCFLQEVVDPAVHHSHREARHVCYRKRVSDLPAAYF